MYGWGGSTSDWKKPGKYGFDSARSPYLDKLAKDASAKGPRTYTRRDEPDMKLVDAKGKTISTDSENPLVVAVDVTGSMSSWPAEIFDRLPLLYQTLSQYKPDLEICFAAIGDANSDRFPLQVNDFAKGVGLEDKLKALCPEGGGGGQISESYELFGYYMLEHCNMPKAKSPFLLVYGDEKFYNEVKPEQVSHYIGDTLQAPLNSADVWKKLQQKFNVYFLQKRYGDENDSITDAAVKQHWANALGKQNIIDLPSCDRAVDVAMGLVAKQWGEFKDFKENLSARQDEDEAKTVYSSLRFVDGDPSAKSVVSGKNLTKRTMSLSELGKKKTK